MAQTGYTPISLYYSSTASNTPTAGNLVAGELAINTADGKLFYKDSAGVVQVIGTKGGVGSSTTTQVLYNSSGLVVGSANLTFNGTTLTVANDASISGLTVGKGGGAVSTSTTVGYQGLNAQTAGPNDAFGYQSMLANTSGAYNVAYGYYTLKANTTGNVNSAFGNQALSANTTGSSNTAVGVGSLLSNTTGGNNTAMGDSALRLNTTASNNTAVGYQAGYTTTTAANTVCIGYKAGYAQTTVGSNVYVGESAGLAATGGNNTFIGDGSGYLITSGQKNSILGSYTGNNGGLDIRTSSNYIVLSDGDGNPRAYWNNNGHAVFYMAGNSDTVCDFNNGNASPYGISFAYTAAAPNGTGNYFWQGSDTGGLRAKIVSNGGLYNYSANNSNLSDQREKKDIELAGNYLDKVCAIPVKTFLYNDQTDTELNLGVIAQDVQSVAPELVTESNWGTDEEPKIRLSIYQTDLQYALMKAIQELNAKVTALEAQLGA